MAVKIRFQRFGAPQKPFFRLVVIDGRKKRNGAFIQAIGTYDPRTKSFKVDSDKIKLWLSRGAQMSDTAQSLYKKHLKTQQQLTDLPEVTVTQP